MKRKKQTVRIGITLGDVNGIGPEVALRAALRRRWPAHVRVVLIGSSPVVKDQSRHFGFTLPPVWNPESPSPPHEKVTIWDPTPQLAPRWKPGNIRKDASEAAAAWICSATEACKAGCLDAMVTAPICKEGFHAAGIQVPGHTEMLANLTGSERFAMMLFGGGIRVVLVTRHVPLKKVASKLSIESILEAVTLTAEALPWMGLRRKRIAVCGLNPHAGDGGKIGREEIDIIKPAIRRARRKRYDVTGPVPADVVFHAVMKKKKYDAVVAMYHDQGLAPMKMVAFDAGVNLTLGLPIVRTSPDHGTAFDIAGMQKADEGSMTEAIHWAAKLAARRNPWKRA